MCNYIISVKSCETIPLESKIVDIDYQPVKTPPLKIYFLPNNAVEILDYFYPQGMKLKTPTSTD